MLGTIPTQVKKLSFSLSAYWSDEPVVDSHAQGGVNVEYAYYHFEFWIAHPDAY
jgi:hypothetical protein